MVTGTPEDRRNEATLDRFARGVAPSARLLDQLRPTLRPHRFRPSGCRSASERPQSRARSPISPGGPTPRSPGSPGCGCGGWLVAPTDLGGLDMNRTQVHELTPRRLRHDRPAIGTRWGVLLPGLRLLVVVRGARHGRRVARSTRCGRWPTDRGGPRPRRIAAPARTRAGTGGTRICEGVGRASP